MFPGRLVADIDRRMLDYLVDLQPEMNELVEGSYLVTPSAEIEDLVLPQEQKTGSPSAPCSCPTWACLSQAS